VRNPEDLEEAAMWPQDIEPCPRCGCSGEKYDGHCCEDVATEALVAQVRKSVAEWHTDSTPMEDLWHALETYDAALNAEVAACA